MGFSILNWNIEGSKYYTRTSFKKISPNLKESTADIFCLQEAQEIKEKISTFSNIEKFNYVFQNNINDRNVILSRFPVKSSGELSFPDTISASLEKAIWADIEIDGKTVRIYNCHLEIVGVGPKQRAEQLKHILNDAKKHIGPVIICGDMNTTVPAAGLKRKFIQWFHKVATKNIVLDENHIHNDERHSFIKIAEQEGFIEATDISKATWCIMPLRWEIFKLKLDWFFIRDIEKPKISMGNYISDHRSIFAEF